MTRAMLLYNTLQAARAAAGEVGWSYLRLVGPGLPDVPRWVETRSMLLSGRCEVFRLEEGEDLGFVVRDAEDVLVSVVGCPGSEAIEEAVAREWEETLSSPRPKIALMWPRRCRDGEPFR